MTVANTAVPTVSAIREVGATPAFCDVEANTCLMDIHRLEECLTDRTKAVIPVHLFGNVVDVPNLRNIIGARSIAVVEDCAQAHGASYCGAHVGGFGSVGCFSFYPTKNLGAFGDGGLCVCRDPDLEQHLRALRTYGFRDDRHAHFEGLNSRLDEIQAAVLRVKLRRLSRAIEVRRELAQGYIEGLAGSPYRPVELTPDGEHSFHLLVVRAPDRPRLIEHLNRAEIGFGIHYPEPVHLMEAYSFLGHRAGDLPVTEKACETVISLPLFPGLEAGEVEQVVKALLDCA